MNVMRNKNIELAVSTTDTAPDTAPLLLLGDVCENLRAAHSFGYSAIEIHTRENVDLDCKKIMKTCKELNMSIAAIVTGRLHNEEKVTLIDDDTAKVQQAMQGLKKYIDLAHDLETDIIIGWIRGNIPKKGESKFYEKRLAENIKQLALYGMKKNVKIFIEALNRYEMNLFNTGREVINFIEEYELKNTYIHLDTFHMNIEEVNITDAIKECSNKLGYIHFADSNRQYPGAGHLDFSSILEALEEIDYNGYISVECLPKPSGLEAAKLTMKHIKSLV